MTQETALDILKSGDNVFITGSAGTGKTYLLNQFIAYLKKQKIYPSIVASTGIAASHLKGQTVHAFFAIGIRDEVDAVFLEGLKEKKYLIERFANLEILIIDEVSMISPKLFTVMDEVLRAFKNEELPFGGVQVVISGDFFQLPPVQKESTDKRFAWQAPAWKALSLQTCYLTEKYRQEDDTLIKILDEIRNGHISQETYDIFNSRFNKELEGTITPTKLYTHNIDIDRINQEALDRLPNPSKLFVYESKGAKNQIEKVFKSSLVQESLELKKEAVVIFIKNNPEKGYLNGTTGVVTGFTKEGLPQVKLHNGETINVELDEWTVDDKNGKVTATVYQVPLKLAWAITIHKSQGMTLDQAEIDLSKAFEVGQGYVALSRLKSIKGLRLLGLNEKALQVDPLILKIDPHIQQASIKSEEKLATLGKAKMKEQHSKRLEQLGSTAKKTMQSSHDITKNLIEQCDTIEELAKQRGLAFNTVVNHLIILKDLDENLTIEKYKPDNALIKTIQNSVKVLHKLNNPDHFTESGRVKLKPIFQELNEEVSYDSIRVAMLFI